ncbi:MAG: hypothetical protein J7J98_03470 [candidate division Zixibacteria bacterium]|nr:hypothetical protein [candidate division Zixibacteria bacterium]
MSNAEHETGNGLTSGEPPDEGELLEWTCHPVKRKPLVSAAVTLFIILVVVAIYMTTYSRMFTLLGLVILLMSLAKFYFPTRFKMSESGVTIKTTTQTLFKEWGIYRSCYPDKKGILLSPFVEPSRIENFRGLYVMFEGNADVVTAFVKQRIRRAHPEIDTALPGGPTA